MFKFVHGITAAEQLARNDVRLSMRRRRIGHWLDRSIAYGIVVAVVIVFDKNIITIITIITILHLYHLASH